MRRAPNRPVSSEASKTLPTLLPAATFGVEELVVELVEAVGVPNKLALLPVTLAVTQLPSLLLVEAEVSSFDTNLMSVVLKQFVSSTCSTSAGSANVMSTHYDASPAS